MKRKMILFIIICTLIITGMQSWADAKPSKIFFVNCLISYMDISVRNADNGEIFYRSGISPVSMTTYSEVEKYGKYSIFFKHAEEEEWYFWQKGNGKPVFVPVEEGNIYCVLMQDDGTINYFILNDDSGEGARIAFLNATKNPVEKMEIGEYWNKGTVAMAENLNSYVITNFVLAEPGDYGMFYKLTGRDTFFTLEGDTGSEFAVVPFVDNSYYVYLIYEDENIWYPYLFDITLNLKSDPDPEIGS
jgi:hypothetical protein